MLKDRIFSIVVIIVCIVMFLETFNFSTSSPYNTGPELFPRIIILIVFLLSAALLIKSFFTKSEGRKTFISLKEFIDHYGSTILFFISFLIYTILLPILGFIFATLLFMFFAQTILTGFKKKKLLLLNVVISSISTIGVYFTFTEVLSLWLP